MILRKISLIFTNTLKRSYLFLILAFAVGCILTGFYGLQKNQGRWKANLAPVGLISHEQTPLSDKLKQYLTEDLDLLVVESNDLSYLNKQMLDRRISTIIQIPKGYENGMISGNVVPLTTSFLNDYENGAFVNAYLEGWAASVYSLSQGSTMSLEGAITSSKEKLPKITYEESSQDQDREDEQNALSTTLGFCLMTSFLLGLLTASQIFEDRVKGVFDRTRLTGIGGTSYVLGICGAGFLNGICLSVPFLLYIAGTGAYTSLSVWSILLLLMTYELFVIGFSLLVAMNAGSQNIMTTIIIGVSSISCILGGAYFPLSMSPIFLQRLARAMPQYWLMDALENPKWGLDVFILFLFAALTFILSGVKFKGKRQTI
jgi:ABC-2 type transport system permease protein